MTFDSDLVRLLFHQLPTETQVGWNEGDRQLQSVGKQMHIVSVMQDGETSNVIVRITEKLHADAVTDDSFGL